MVKHMVFFRPFASFHGDCRHSTTTETSRFPVATRIVRAIVCCELIRLSWPFTVPGCVMAAARHNRPTIIVYGGTISPGVRHVDCPGMGFKKGEMVNIGDAFESYGWTPFLYSAQISLFGLIGAYLTSSITDEQRFDVVRHACPGPGACGGMYTQVSPYFSDTHKLLKEL